MQQESQPTVKTLLETSTWIYGIIGSVGFIMAWFGHHSIPQILHWPKDFAGFWPLAVVTGACVGLLLITNYFFEEYSAAYRDLRSTLSFILGQLNHFQILYLALLSALGEEWFFRAGVQPFLGIFFTSLLFGLLHLGPNGKMSLWTLWAVIAGILFGWMFQGTQNIWPCFCAHGLVNIVGLVRLKRLHVASLAAGAKRVTSQELRPH